MPTIGLEGLGASIAFSVSAYVADLIMLTLPDETVAPLDTTHLGTLVAHTSKPSQLVKIGNISCEFDHNPASPRLRGVVQTFTIAWPLRSGQTTPYKRVYSGYVTKEGSEEMKVESLMRSKITIEVSGNYSEVAAT